MAFVFVVLLLPEVESQLAELLQRHLGLSFRQVNEEALLEVDHVHAGSRRGGFPKGVRLVCQVETWLPATSTEGRRLHRLTSNLVENALEVTGSGEVVVHLQADPPGLVREVMDGGPPLPGTLLEWINRRTPEEPDFPAGREQRLRAIRQLTDAGAPDHPCHRRW